MWKTPKEGDVVWCRFPELPDVTRPGPKARPALVVAVGQINGAPVVTVAYGTTQRVDYLFPAEFAITRADGDAFEATGLEHDTKFNLAKRVDLPYDTTWFDVAPRIRHGQSPKMGHVTMALERRLRKAVMAALNR